MCAALDQAPQCISLPPARRAARSTVVATRTSSLDSLVNTIRRSSPTSHLLQPSLPLQSSLKRSTHPVPPPLLGQLKHKQCAHLSHTHSIQQQASNHCATPRHLTRDRRGPEVKGRAHLSTNNGTTSPLTSHGSPVSPSSSSNLKTSSLSCTVSAAWGCERIDGCSVHKQNERLRRHHCRLDAVLARFEPTATRPDIYASYNLTSVVRVLNPSPLFSSTNVGGGSQGRRDRMASARRHHTSSLSDLHNLHHVSTQTRRQESGRKKHKVFIQVSKDEVYVVAVATERAHAQ